MRNADAVLHEAQACSPAATVPGTTSVALMHGGMAAFAARVQSARAAQSTLDLQYYIWRDDLTGRLLVREILRAADRGIRVRLLLDDMYAIGRERVLAVLDQHPNVEVRLFNGTTWRRWGLLGYALEMLLGGRHLNRRMHNKAWVADGRVAICGGRNIGDEYFDAGEAFVFRDLDVAVVGPAAAEAQSIFDRYWAYPLARPVAEVSHIPARRELRRLTAAIEAACRAAASSPFLNELRDDPVVTKVLAGTPVPAAVAAPDTIRIVADPPAKAGGTAQAADCLAPTLLHALLGAQREVLLISPYFVPGETGLAKLLAQARRGIRICVVTNSLAATDVVAVHGGYARYRERMLEAGITIHELKPVGDERVSVFGSRGASLHTKALLIDGELAFVGSFNLDPRSATLNTEMGVFLRHPDITRQLREEHARLTDPARSWKVSRAAPGKLLWTSDTTATTEPDASLSRRALAWLVRRLPVESQL